ncbi:DUF2497 domain-containing protein [Xanthobacter sp. AM11]|uniref:DUF2497 domain-containing protein n=1 Tax=Xanthobacter sp. AM11 TaxID=3380643 RepID=UPI0039BFDEE7
MEEILASIRRIMADDELPMPPRRPAVVPPPPHRYGGDAAADAARYGEPAAPPPRRPAPPMADDGRGMPEDQVAEEGHRPARHAAGPSQRPLPPESVARPQPPEGRMRPVAPEGAPRAPRPVPPAGEEERPPVREVRSPQPAARPKAYRAPPEDAHRPGPEADIQGFEDEFARTVRPLRDEVERNGALQDLEAAMRAAQADEMAAAPRAAAPAFKPRPAAPSPARSADWAQSDRDAPESPAATPARDAAPRPHREDGPRRRDLLSPGVDAAVAAAFQSLGDAVLPHKERTIEDLVKEILRPMLKDWLDQRLPGIVEGLVRAEIERVTRQGR